MSYFDFVIRKEQVLLRNTYSNEDLQKSTNLKNLESFHLAFQKILKIMIFMENHLHNCESYENIYNDELKGFLEENCQAYSNDIRMFIEETKMIEKKSTTKIPKFALQIYAFVYDIIMKFPFCNFSFETVITQGLF